MPSTFGNFCDIVLKIYRIVYSYREAVTTCCCCRALLARSIYIYYIYYRVGNVDLFLDMTSNYPDAYLSDVNGIEWFWRQIYNLINREHWCQWYIAWTPLYRYRGVHVYSDGMQRGVDVVKGGPGGLPFWKKQQNPLRLRTIANCFATFSLKHFISIV